MKTKEAISTDEAALLVLTDTLRRLEYTIGIAEKMDLEKHHQKSYVALYKAKKQLLLAIDGYKRAIAHQSELSPEI